MKYQITSAQGPAECEIAAAKFLQVLQKEFPEIRIVDKEPENSEKACRTVVIAYEGSADMPQGTIQWICQSPCRTGHKRKNWFIGIFPLSDVYTEMPCTGEIHFETFKSAGKGGQNVNKVETGVRAIYQPTGLSAVSTQERSQYANKRIAAERLLQKIQTKTQAEQMLRQIQQRDERLQLQRGCPVRVYQGMGFQRVK